jgi:DNA invertase Pin-like site-specific DNA recombinase
MTMRSTAAKPAIAFFRRGNGRANVAPGSDQRALIESFAARSGYEIAFEFVYAGASCEELFESDAFGAMLERIEAKKALTVIVASATTFSADPLVQAVGSAEFHRHGIELLVADLSDAPAITTSAAQIVDHVFQIRERFEAHLSRMEERRRLRFGPQRRKNYVEMFPEAVSLAKSLHEKSLREGVRTSLRELSAILARQGHLNNAGNPYHPDEVRRMIKGPDPLRVAV